MPPPATTAFGALLNHITGGHIGATSAGPRSFQPMNINFGLFPPIGAAERHKGKAAERSSKRKHALSVRALADLDRWLAQRASIAAE
jgi:methylenetetrahydrofolate--tRNA-(uracil-5-)-methyltransferase